MIGFDTKKGFKRDQRIKYLRNDGTIQIEQTRIFSMQMLSQLCVATITGLDFLFARKMALFCQAGTSHASTSTPKSPRATMIESLSSMISSRLFSSATGRSSLAIILILSLPALANCALTFLTSYTVIAHNKCSEMRKRQCSLVYKTALNKGHT